MQALHAAMNPLKELFTRPTNIHDLHPLMNLLLVRAKDFLNCPNILPSSSCSSGRVPVDDGGTLTPRLLRYHFRHPPTWYNNLIAYYRSHRETVPYTNRTRFILLSPAMERWFGNLFFQFEPTNLPPTHPDSCRVKLILNKIIRAAHRAGIATPVDWDVVVDKAKRSANAGYLPGGKIIIYSGLLEHLTTNAEIATIISHEVGHVIARHAAERLTNRLWFMLPHIILLKWSSIFMYLFSGQLWKFFFRLPLSRRMEIEADYIGLLLLASAGYDPRIAPKVLQKVGEITGTDKYMMLAEFTFTHPLWKKRSQLLAQSMEEALDLYLKGIIAGNY